jgi:hypothetical protein
VGGGDAIAASRHRASFCDTAAAAAVERKFALGHSKGIQLISLQLSLSVGKWDFIIETN